MKVCFKCVGAIFVALFVLEITPVSAQNPFAQSQYTQNKFDKTFRLASDGEEKIDKTDGTFALASDEVVTPTAKSTCGNSCSEGCECESACNVRPLCRPYSESCPRVGLYTYAGFESWRGVSDGLTNNNGAFTGANMGIPIPKLKDYGFGLQLGATYGVYDWMGRATNGSDEANRSQQQVFITAGVFRRADEDCGWSGGFVHDWMVNDNFGTLSMEPYLGQWRAQVGYAMSGKK